MQHIDYFLLTIGGIVCATIVIIFLLLVWFMIKHRNDFTKEQALHIGGVAHSFDCYLCGGTFNREGKPCMHYDKDEMDEEGEVSLCDDCADKVMRKSKQEKIQGLSRRFFNCG